MESSVQKCENLTKWNVCIRLLKDVCFNDNQFQGKHSCSQTRFYWAHTNVIKPSSVPLVLQCRKTQIQFVFLKFTHFNNDQTLGITIALFFCHWQIIQAMPATTTCWRRMRRIAPENNPIMAFRILGLYDEIELHDSSICLGL